jgi:uncharacterized membrane protein YeaQ/YmgE (transglycosylase-associated protein family)
MGLGSMAAIVVVLFASAIVSALADARRRRLRHGAAFWCALGVLGAWAAVLVMTSNDAQTDLPFLWPLPILLGVIAVCAAPWRTATRRFLLVSAIVAPLAGEVILLVVNATEGLGQESLATMVPVAFIVSLSLYSAPAMAVWALLADPPRASPSLSGGRGR